MGEYWNNWCPIAQSQCITGKIGLVNKNFWTSIDKDTTSVQEELEDKARARCKHWDSTGSKCKLWT